MPDIATVLRMAAVQLAKAGVEDPMGDARRLMARHVPAPLAARMNDLLDVDAHTAFQRDIDLRATRVPVVASAGLAGVWGRRFVVTRDVLDPRPDTETLIEAALAGPKPARVLDLGTGSGAILATVLAEWPDATGLATDLSDAALKIARRNLEQYAPGRFDIVQSDWFADVAGQFDLIVSNPPYIAAAAMPDLAPEVREHEPAMALSPGGDGLDAYRAIARDYRRFLKPGGQMLLEIGFDQGESAAALFCSGAVEVLNDLNGKPRVLRMVNHVCDD